MDKKIVVKWVKRAVIGLLVPILLGFFAAGGFGVWYLFFRQTPRTVLEDAIQRARQRDQEQFKACFSAASVRAMEGSWTTDAMGSSGSWNAMMQGLLEPNGAPPEITDEKTTDNRARLEVRLRGERRAIYFEKIESLWKIDVLTGIDAGLSEEARKLQAKQQPENPKDGKSAEEVLAPPPEENWWK